jgi:uroporphyrinogen-III decarboxylase
MDARRTWTEGPLELSEDLWGNIWHRVSGRSASGEISRPAIMDWSMLDSYEMPDLAHPALYADTRRAFAAAPEKYHLSMIPGFPFAICRYLRKMEVFLQDLLLEQKKVDTLHERVTDLLERMIGRYVESGADGIFFCEDWGTQRQLLISPRLWREIYKPLYRRLCGYIHARGAHVIMHSCGYIWDILDDLAECGVDCLQFDQPRLYGLERLAGKLRRLRICLFAPVDIQRVLPTGDRVVIEREAGRMVELFGGTPGGFIARQYGDLHGIGVDVEWDRWAYDAFVRHGGFTRRPSSL